MSDPSAVSLFDGIGGFPEALRQAGIRTVATVEIDSAAAGVTADRFPDARQFNDVTEVAGDDLRAVGFDPKRGILTAGWPCQDLSLAGRRLGLGGARSGLFWEVVRLVADLRPRWLILENVPGLLSAVCSCPGLGLCGGGCTDPHPVRGGACGPGRCMELHGGAMGSVLGSLGELGYGLAYRVLDAQYFGVPQQRRRVVIVGCLGDWAAPAQVLLEPEGGAGNPTAGGTATGGIAAEDACGGVGDGSKVGPLLTTSGGWRVGGDEASAGHVVITHALTSEGADASEDGAPLVAADAAVRRLTPMEYERLQGFPDGWTATSYGRPQSDSARYRQLGNSIAVPVFEWVASRLVTYEESPGTLDTSPNVVKN